MDGERQRGFTLIEVLVALFVLAIIAVAAFRGLNAVMEARNAVAQETRKWQAMMFFFSRLEQDVALAIPRPIRDRTGQSQPAWVGRDVPVAQDDGQLVLTRAGAQDEQSAQIGPQRIGYRLDHNTVYLLRWMALDQPPNAAPQRYPVLQGVSDFHLRYEDTTGAWSEQWPTSGRMDDIPAAVEVRVTLEGGQPVTRLFLTR